MRWFIFILLSSILFSCQSGFDQQHSHSDPKNTQTSSGFSILEKNDSVHIIEISEPFPGSSVKETYAIVSEGYQLPATTDEITHYIRGPVRSVAITSTTHLGFLKPLGKMNAITGLSNPDLFYDQGIKKRMAKGKVKSIGLKQIEQEQIIQLDPDLVFAYVIDAAGMREVNRLRQLGVKVILISEFMENDPLKKASWIKVFAQFFDEKTQKMAEEIIADIERKYKRIKEKAKAYDQYPKVMIGYPWKGNWYVSGGQSFQAKLFEDAGADYLWKDYDQRASVPLSVEKVIHEGLEANFWVNCGSMQSFSQIAKDNPTFKHFKAFQERRIFNNYKRSNSLGANDYWESGIVQPDLILQDLVTIFHADEFSDEDLYFYSKIAP